MPGWQRVGILRGGNNEYVIGTKMSGSDWYIFRNNDVPTHKPPSRV
jgi:hypothetical protein